MPTKYIPAAWNPLNSGGLAIYTRYREGNDSLDLVSRDTQHMRFHTPDRELLLVRNFNEQIPFNSFEDWDEVNYLGLTSATAKSFGFTHYMINYVTFLDKLKFSPRHRAPFHRTQDGITVLSDSGGFQLARRRIEYIDPVHLAHWYNENVDIGMSLDIPVFNNDADVYERASNVLKKNNEIMLQEIDDHTQLMNVIHGTPDDLSTFIAYAKKVHNPKITKTAIAGIYYGTVLDAVSRMLHIVEFLEKEWPGHYNHIHILGIFNTRLLLPIMFAMNARFPHIQVTADSTSWLQYSINNTFLYHTSPDRSIEKAEVGYTALPAYKTFSRNRMLPCRCPVCEPMKYMDLFTYSRGFMTYYLHFHNMYVMVHYVNMMNELASRLELADFKTLSVSQVKSLRKIDAQETASSFDFIETYLNEGLKKADHRYTHWLSRKMGIRTVFGKSTTLLKNDIEEIEELDNDKDTRDWQRQIVAVYEGKLPIPEKSKLRKSLAAISVGNKRKKKIKRGLGKEKRNAKKK